MTTAQKQPRVVSATREIAAGPERIFELIADPAQQPRWDGNDNLAGAPGGQRVRRAGEVFTMTLTHDGAIRENHVAEFEEGRRIAWRPAESGQRPPGHLWRWELEPAGPSRTRVTCTYDWTQLTDQNRFRTARATTAGKLRAPIDRLAALAEAPWPPAATRRLRQHGVPVPPHLNRARPRLAGTAAGQIEPSGAAMAGHVLRDGV
jgi:uncharacterized protein YndB with AHSA1/START domain